MKQAGYILFIMLIVLLIISTLSISLFKVTLLADKINQHASDKFAAFYQAENCLGIARQLLEQQKAPLAVILNCRSNNCANLFQPLLNLNQQTPNWWQQYGTHCTEKNWIYWEFLQKNDVAQDYYYRVNIYNEQQGLIQATFKWHMTTQAVSRLSWQQVTRK
jgi:hypothetical protein